MNGGKLASRRVKMIYKRPNRAELFSRILKKASSASPPDTHRESFQNIAGLLFHFRSENGSDREEGIDYPLLLHRLRIRFP